MPSRRPPQGGAPLSLLEERNRAAEALLGDYARRHAKTDAATGVIGGLIPFGGPVIAAGQLYRQSKHLYPALAKDLAAIYASPAHDFSAVFRDARRDEKRIRYCADRLKESCEEVAQVGLMLALSFDGDFVQEVATDVAKENGPGLLASFIPVIGAAATGGLDALLAIVMTWRVGSMMAVHMQHDGFVGTRKNTWKLVKRNLVPMSPEIDRPKSLTRMRTKIPAVQVHLQQVADRTLRDFERGGLSRSEAVLRMRRADAWRVPADLLPAA